MRDSKHTKTTAQVSQDAGFSTEVGKRPTLCEGTWTLVCREHTLLRSTPDSTFVGALCDNVRMGPVLDAKTTDQAGLHSTEILIPSKNNLSNCSWALNVEVQINTLLRNVIWSNSLPKKQSVILHAKKISQPRETLARATNKKTKRRTARRHLAHT